MVEYLVERISTNPSLAPIADALASPSNHVGLIISERMINMPAEIVPPMYTMLIDEVDAAIEDKEPYEFTHYLVLSRAYIEVESALESEPTERKSKKIREDPTASQLFFHAEDEVLSKLAQAHGRYSYRKIAESSADSKRAFREIGIEAEGLLMLFEAKKLPDAIQAVSDFISSSV